jgi:hypothetical protein
MTYSNTPLANQTPAASQPQMQQNFAQIATSYNTDHIPLTSGTNVGFHQQVTLASSVAPGAQTDPNSIIYSSAGTASSVVQPFYKNQNSAFMLLPIKAWGVIFSGALAVTQSYNVTSYARSAAGNFTVTLTAKAVASSSFAVLTTCNMTSGFVNGGISGVDSLAYNVGTFVGSFQINVRALTGAFGTDAYPISFIVLQI